MIKTNRWKPVNSQNHGYESKDGSKPIVEGPGPFIDESGNSNIEGKTIIRTWRSSASSFIFMFTCIWNFFVCFFISFTWDGPLKINGTSYSSLQEAYRLNPTTIIFALFPLVGILLAYISIALLINRTKVSIDGDKLTVKRGPLPWFPQNLVVSTTSIRQVYIEEYSSHSENNRPVISFRVMLQMSKGNDVLFDKGFSNYSSARILEQWLEQRLMIEDQRVPGEVSA